MAIVIQNPNDKKSKRNQTDNNKQFVGIKFPLEKDAYVGYFESSTLTIEATKQNLQNFVKTRKGERIFHPDLGLGLEDFLFENLDDNTETMIKDTISSSVKKWMPFLTIQDIDINQDDSNINRINIVLSFIMNTSPGTLESVEINL